ncbi:hypothetical protein [[Mycoplasma] testudinis]|uniref:hypothetical protein n=1 Tax=[Mycoplasma] testudinis TaxID=33924 RepID=UPI000482A3A9|nr:hypothetical protein [[Mycoplasma] testudinis]
MKKINKASKVSAETTPKEIKKKWNFHFKTWIGIWSLLGIAGSIIVIAPIANFQINDLPKLEEQQDQLNQQQAQQQMIANFYAELSRTKTYDVNSSQTNFLPSQSTIPETTDTTTFSRFIVNPAIPSLSVTLANQGFVLQFIKGSSDNSNGSLTIKGVLTQNLSSGQIFYNSDGTTANSIENAGITITLTGFNTTTNIIQNAISSYYKSIQPILKTNSAQANVFADNPSVLTTTPTINQLNAILDSSSQLPAFPQVLIASGFNITITKGNVDRNNGTIIVNTVIKDATGKAYGADGNLSTDSGFNGTEHTIQWFKAAFLTASVNTPALGSNFVLAQLDNGKLNGIQITPDIISRSTFTANATGFISGPYQFIRFYPNANRIAFWQRNGNSFQGIVGSLQISNNAITINLTQAQIVSVSAQTDTNAFLANTPGFLTPTNQFLSNTNGYGLNNLVWSFDNSK